MSKLPHKAATNRAGARARQEARPATLAQQAAFLGHFAEHGVITAAAEAAGIDRKRHYEWLADEERYPDYADRYKDANERACDRLEKEAIRRGAEGWDEPVYQGGKKVGVVRRHSDRMLELVLKARMPDKYRERHDVTTGGEKLPGPVDLSRLSDETLNRAILELRGRIGDSGEG